MVAFGVAKEGEDSLFFLFFYILKKHKHPSLEITMVKYSKIIIYIFFHIFNTVTYLKLIILIKLNRNNFASSNQRTLNDNPYFVLTLNN